MGKVGLRILLGDSPLELSGCVPDEHGLGLYYSARRQFAPSKSDRRLREMLAKTRHAVSAPKENIVGRCCFRRAASDRGQDYGNLCIAVTSACSKVSRDLRSAS